MRVTLSALIDRPVRSPETPRQPPPRRPWRRWQIALIVGGSRCVERHPAAPAASCGTTRKIFPISDSCRTTSRVWSHKSIPADKRLIGQFFIERRILTPLPQIPEHLRRAVIAVEDVRFFEHPGLDYIGIMRAAWTNLRRGGKVEGASTITQQLARSLFLSSERTFDRKVRELVLAYKMELVSSKEQIFETYLNQIYFGQGAYGVAAAAQSYFGKDLSALTIAEAAFLAGLPKSPNHFSPFKNYARAKKRQEHVLDRMAEAGFITPPQHDEAMRQSRSASGGPAVNRPLHILSNTCGRC